MVAELLIFILLLVWEMPMRMRGTRIVEFRLWKYNIPFLINDFSLNDNLLPEGR